MFFSVVRCKQKPRGKMCILANPYFISKEQKIPNVTKKHYNNFERDIAT
jgi:hypothetical protein